MTFKRNADKIIISIHAPREGSDLLLHFAKCLGKLFQSTLPVRGATVVLDALQHLVKDFNPRSP